MVDYEAEKRMIDTFRILKLDDGLLTITKEPQEIMAKCGCKVKKYIHEDGAYIVEQDWCEYHAKEEGIA